MLKAILSLLLVTSLSISVSQAQSRVDFLGLPGEISFLKNSAEFHASRIMNDKSLDDSTRVKAAWKYNEMAILLDQIIMQLVSDKRRNYKVIDNALMYKKLEFLFPEEFPEGRQKAYITALKSCAVLLAELKMLASPSEQIRSYDYLGNQGNQQITYPNKKKFRYTTVLLLLRPAPLGTLIQS